VTGRSGAISSWGTGELRRAKTLASVFFAKFAKFAKFAEFATASSPGLDGALGKRRHSGVLTGD
jgi:hypothetical protein